MFWWKSDFSFGWDIGTFADRGPYDKRSRSHRDSLPVAGPCRMVPGEHVDLPCELGLVRLRRALFLAEEYALPTPGTTRLVAGPCDAPSRDLGDGPDFHSGRSQK